MKTAAEILIEHGIKLPSDAPGRYYTTCPQCSAKRSKAHQQHKVLGITIDNKGVQWGCNHCGLTGGAYYNGKPNGQARGDIVATYDYVDETGELLFQVCRYPLKPDGRKDFKQRRPDGKGGWIWDMQNTRKVLYRLPELIEAMAHERTILMAEGEKDVNNLWKIGLPATCNPGGASEPGKKTKWRAEYNEQLPGSDVVILPDNDEPGYAHADAIARSMAGVAKRVRVLKLAEHWPEVAARKGGDVSDGLAAGHTREELEALIEAATDYVAGDQGETGTNQEAWDWRYYGRQESTIERKYLVEKLLPEIGVGLISGQWGTYKTFVALDLAAAVITDTDFAGFPVARPGAVLFVALEGEGEVTIRIRAALAHRGRAEEFAPFAWIDACPRLLDSDAGGQLARMVKQAAERLKQEHGLPVVLVIIDTAGKAAGYEKSGDENDAVLGRQIVAAFAGASRATGALFLGIDHFGKDATTGTRGSAKEADCDVVLALIGDKSISGEVTNPRLAIRKRRSGANGVEIPFKPLVVSADEATEETTLVIEWGQVGEEHPTAAKADRWGKGLRLLRRTLMNVLVDHGTEHRPFIDGPTVRAVDVEIVRKEFYSSYLAEGDAKARAEIRRKAFGRAIKDAAAKELIGVRDIVRDMAEITIVWLTTPAEPAGTD